MDSRAPRFLEFLALERGLSSHTVRAYGCDLKQFEDFLRRHWNLDADAAPVADDIGPDDVRTFLAREHSHNSPATRRRKLSALRAFLDWVADHRGDDRNPARSLNSPRLGQHLPNVLSSLPWAEWANETSVVRPIQAQRQPGYLRRRHPQNRRPLQDASQAKGDRLRAR